MIFYFLLTIPNDLVSSLLELDPIKWMTYHLSMTQHFILWICFFLKQWVLGVPQDSTLFEIEVSYSQSATSARQKVAGSVEILLLWATGYCLGFRSIYHIHFQVYRLFTNIPKFSLDTLESLKNVHLFAKNCYSLCLFPSMPQSYRT